MQILAGPLGERPDGVFTYRPIGFEPRGALGFGDLVGLLAQCGDPPLAKTATHEQAPDPRDASGLPADPAAEDEQPTSGAFSH